MTFATTTADQWLLRSAIGFVAGAMVIGGFTVADTSNRRERLAQKRLEMAQKWDGATPLFCRVKHGEKGGRKFEPVSVNGLNAEEIKGMRAKITMAQCNTQEITQPAKPAIKAPNNAKCPPGGNVIGQLYGRVRTIAPRC